MLDFDEPKTLSFLQFISKEMSVGARIMIVDPVSHEFCHEKEDIVKQTLSQESCWNEEYHGNDKVSVTRSILEPFIQDYCTSLQMQINRDIKFSCHTWTLLLCKKSAHIEAQIEAPIETPPICTTLILTQSSYISEWSNQLRQSCRTNFWGPRDLSYLHHALIHRLVHAWSQYGGVLCLPYSW